MSATPKQQCRPPIRLKRLLRHWGPTLATRAAHDDPSGIATYSQAGAQFGLQMLWTLVLTYPLITGIQPVSVQLGRVTGRGLAAISSWFSRYGLSPLVIALVVANTINIAADVAAMGEAAVPTIPHSSRDRLHSGLRSRFARPANLDALPNLCAGAQMANAGTFGLCWRAVHGEDPWPAVAVGAFLPHFKIDSKSMTMIVAIFGTTISPYLFFWQSSQEVEEIEATTTTWLKKCPREGVKVLRRIKIDTTVGMPFRTLLPFSSSWPPP